MAFAFIYTGETRENHKVEVAAGNTVIHEIRALGRLEAAELHVEKTIALKDEQRRLYGIASGTDALLYIAVGEVVLGVDLAKLAENDTKLDPKTRIAEITLPEPEVLSTRFDEK